MKYKLKPIPSNIVVHTPTEAEAKELLEILHENGWKWICGDDLSVYSYAYKKEAIGLLENKRIQSYIWLETAIKEGKTILALAEFKERFIEEEEPRVRVGDKVRTTSSNSIHGYYWKGIIIKIDGDFAVIEKLKKGLNNTFEARLSDLAIYTEPTEENSNPIDTNDMQKEMDSNENKELNLCELLKGHEGETFYSTISGNVKITDFCDGVMKPIGTTNERYCSDGKYQRGGAVCLFPSRDLYEQYPLDPCTAWQKWVEEQKKFGLDIKIETYFEGKFGWEDCDDNVSCLHFRTPADRDKCIKEFKSVIEKYSKV